MGIASLGVIDILSYVYIGSITDFNRPHSMSRQMTEELSIKAITREILLVNSGRE
jgi:hypothetical protein